MPCYHPLAAGRSKLPDPNTGKHRIAFQNKFASQYEAIQLPCGRCRGCRHDHARQWAVRICHEASLYEGNCFITLTFDDKKSEYKQSLKKRDFQLFIKRFRKHYFGNKKSNVRYFHCGEYGEKLGRPHHHAILFNHTFDDKTLWKTEDGNDYYRSKTLEEIWPYGNSIIGACTYQTAAYVARYVIKKINGKMAPDHYQGRIPEYTTMSRRPGIGRGWYEKYKNTDVFPRDYIVINGVRQKVPKYYNKCYELTNPDEYGILRQARITKAKENENNHPDRLRDAEKICMARDQQNEKRKYENAI